MSCDDSGNLLIFGSVASGHDILSYIQLAGRGAASSQLLVLLLFFHSFSCVRFEYIEPRSEAPSHEEHR